MRSAANLAHGICALTAMFSLGCGDDGPSVRDKCENIVDTVCDRFMACAELAGGFADATQRRQARSQCEDNFERATECERVKRIGENYDACIGALEREQCSALIAEDENSVYEVPAVCELVVRY